MGQLVDQRAIFQNKVRGAVSKIDGVTDMMQPMGGKGLVKHFWVKFDDEQFWVTIGAIVPPEQHPTLDLLRAEEEREGGELDLLRCPLHERDPVKIYLFDELHLRDHLADIHGIDAPARLQHCVAKARRDLRERRLQAQQSAEQVWLVYSDVDGMEIHSLHLTEVEALRDGVGRDYPCKVVSASAGPLVEAIKAGVVR